MLKAGHLAAFEQAYVTVEGGNTFTEELNQGCFVRGQL